MATNVATERKVRAGDGAQAWINAAIACSQDDARRAIYRTISIEFFRSGVQFVATDGHVLFRTWAPYSDIGDLDARHPESDEAPEESVVVADVDKFALGFMKTLLAALDEESYLELSMTVQPADSDAEPALGDELTKEVLVLQALGQRLTCQVFEGPYPDWRHLEFGLDKAELVDGMMLAPKIFAAVGKLKGVNGIECSFHGEERAIEIRTPDNGSLSVRGLLMPMRRLSKADRQTAGEDEQ